jgi:hypothetical protein
MRAGFSARSWFVADQSPEERGAKRFSAGTIRPRFSSILLKSIDLSPMPNREEMNLILFQVKGVNDSIIADTRVKTVRAFCPVMREGREPRTAFINSLSGNLRKTESKLE